MLHLTHVREGEWTRWQGETPPDQCEPIPPGVYYRVGVTSPSEKTKRSYGLIAARGPGIKFCWLAPGELWIHRFMTGPFNPPKCRSTKVDCTQSVTCRWIDRTCYCRTQAQPTFAGVEVFVED